MSDWQLLVQEPGLQGVAPRLRESLATARRVRIASAYVSEFAARELLDAVPANVPMTIIVGRDMSPSQLAGIALLRRRADVRIWIGPTTFHAKTYIVDGESLSRVIVGSSNFTHGGLAGNVEANLVIDARGTDPTLVALVEGFERWLDQTAVVNDAWMPVLAALAKSAQEMRDLVESDADTVAAEAGVKKLIEEAHASREREKERLRAEAAGAKPFFRPEHYAAFQPSKHMSVDAFVVRERRNVSRRFIELHEQLIDRFSAENWDIHPHYKKQHVTSSWSLVPDIVPEISAMWLAYGRSRERFRELDDRDAINVNGFFNFTKLQLLIDEHSLRIGLMIAQRNNAWDRDYLRKKLGFVHASGIVVEPDRVVDLLRQVAAAEPTAYLDRHSHDDEQDRETHLLSTIDKATLTSVVGRDQRGHWFGAWVKFSPDDAAISEGRIVETTVRVFNALYPLYDCLAWYPRKR